MTQDEFAVWLDNHQAHFPGVGTWLGKFAQTEKEAILGVWFKHLWTCEPADCTEATTTLYAQGGRGPVYERHPQAIRSIVRKQELARIADEIKPRYVDGEQVFGCLLCQDDGLLRCWHPKTVAAVIDGTIGDNFTLYTSAVACSCAAGDLVAKSIPRYTPERWAIVGLWGHASTPAQIREDCRKLIEAASQRKPTPAETQETLF